MKKVRFILVLLLGIITFSSCSDDDKLNFGDLPLSSQEFLTQYFPDNQIISISHESPTLKSTEGKAEQDPSYLYVLLNGNIYVTFSEYNGKWVEISAADGIPLSATKILDQHVYNELMRQEPQAKITILYPFYSHSIMMTLDNGHRYAQSQLLAYAGTTLADAEIPDDNFLSKIYDFLKRNNIYLENTLGRIFKITEAEGTAYRLFMGDELIISFDENANWIHAMVNDDSKSTSSAVQMLLNKIAENEIPASVLEAIKNSQTDLGKILIIASYSNGNYGFRFKNVDLLVNEDTGIVPPLTEKADRLIATYYDSSYSLRKGDRLTLVGAYEYTNTFYYVSKEKTVSIGVNTNGDWTLINESYQENGKMVSVSLPSKIIEELPVAIVNYLNEKYKDKDIYSLSHNKYTKGYVVYVDKRYQIYFNEDGSYKRMIEVFY